MCPTLCGMGYTGSVKKFLENCLLDPFRNRGRSSVRGSVTDFFVSCPLYVKAGEAGGVHQLKSLTDLFVFNNFLLLKHRGYLRFLGNYLKNTKLVLS